jgi:hypothetical protein
MKMLEEDSLPNLPFFNFALHYRVGERAKEGDCGKSKECGKQKKTLTSLTGTRRAGKDDGGGRCVVCRF